MAFSKLKKNDKKTKDKLTSAVSKVKGKANKSEVLGFSLRFAQQNLNRFLASLLEDLERDPLLEILRNPARGKKTDAKKIEKYLYS